MYTKNSNEFYINDKVQSSYSEFTLKETKQPIPKQWVFAKHDVQLNVNK